MGIIKKIKEDIEKAAVNKRVSVNQDKKDMGDLSDMGPGEIKEDK